MEPVQTALLKEGADAAIESARGFLKKLVGPAIEEAALLLGDQVRLYRFQNQLQILAKAERMLKAANLSPAAVPLKLLVPLLEHASLEDEAELHDRWAALIANAATGKSLQPLFSEMLGRLSSTEARLLDGLFDNVCQGVRQIAGADAQILRYIHEVDLGNWTDLIRVYVVDALARPELLSVNWAVQYGDSGFRELYRDFGITLDKFLRDAIIWRKQIPAMDAISNNHYVMTVVGYEFIAACHQPEPMDRKL